MLRNSLLEAIDGAADLLCREFTIAPVEHEGRQFVKLKLKRAGKKKATIIEQSDERVIIRLKGGSVRSMPAEEVVRIED